MRFGSCADEYNYVRLGILVDGKACVRAGAGMLSAEMKVLGVVEAVE